MANGKSINGNADGVNGENQSYTIIGRGEISRAKLVKEIEQGKHEGVSTYTVNNTTYARAIPDKKKNNNIDK